MAAVLLGPVLGPGPLLTLDLVLVDPVPVPRGVWGLGPELPRRVPLWLPVAWLAPVISGELLGKLAMAASITLAFAGAYRLTAAIWAGSPGDGGDTGAVPVSGAWLAAGAGVLYGASPFLLTRLAVGHLMVALPMAALPWALPHLLRPHRSLPRTFLAALALGLAGATGGLMALIVAAVGVACARGRDLRGVLAVAVLAQLPWLVPGLIVGGGASPTDANPFSTEMDGPGGALGLVVGHGFWQPAYQVGQAAPVAALGAVVALLAVLGAPGLPRCWRAPFAALAAVGLGGAAASAVPWVRDVLAAVTRVPGAGVLRESQRLAVLALVVIAPCAALGAARVARAAARLVGGPARPTLAGAVAGALAASVLAVGVGLAHPAVWGIDARLRPLDPPPEWAEAQAIVDAGPGTVLALPWHQYFDMRLGGVRRVLNPAPLLLGGDVLVSSDPELGQPERRERLDPREPSADAIVVAAREGRPVSDQLATLGVRWVLVQHEVDWEEARAIGEQDPGLRPALRAPSLDLWEVRAWPGPTAGADGAGDTAGRSAAPLVEPVVPMPDSAAVVSRPYAPGWLRGLRPAGEAPGGLLAVPEGSGPLWYWPVLLVLLGDLLTLSATIIALRALRGSRRADPVAEMDGASNSAETTRAERSGDTLLDPGASIY